MGATILLAPTDPTSPLLADGVCGGRPPVLRSHRHKDGGECWDPKCQRAYVAGMHRDGLVLALDGVPVAEGCDRANRVSGWVRGCVAEWEMADVLPLAHAAAGYLNCRVIVLDGGEVRDA